MHEDLLVSSTSLQHEVGLLPTYIYLVRKNPIVEYSVLFIPPYNLHSGDSYSSISQSWGLERPTPDRPFGVEWPGETFCEEDHPNYVFLPLMFDHSMQDA